MTERARVRKRKYESSSQLESTNQAAKWRCIFAVPKIVTGKGGERGIAIRGNRKSGSEDTVLLPQAMGANRGEQEVWTEWPSHK